MLFFIIFMFSLPAVVFFVVRFFIFFIKKDKEKSTKQLKSVIIASIITIASVTVFASTYESEDTVQAVTPADNQTPIKNNSSSDEKDYYINKLKPDIEKMIGSSDDIWDVHWEAAFETVFKSEVNKNISLGSLKQLEPKYEQIRKVAKGFDHGDLKRENKKLFIEFQEEYEKFAEGRVIAGKMAVKMIERSTLSQKEADDIKDATSDADDHLITALLALTRLESNLGLLVAE